MKLISDAAKFDELQPWFTGELIATVKQRLEGEDFETDKLKALCGDIAFSTCTLLDGSSTFEVNNKEYNPILSFSEEEGEMFFNGGNSYLHEYVFGVLDEFFEDKS